MFLKKGITKNLKKLFDNSLDRCVKDKMAKQASFLKVLWVSGWVGGWMGSWFNGLLSDVRKESNKEKSKVDKK